MLRMGASAQKVTARKGKRRASIAYIYQSDFSSGVDQWAGVSGVLSAVGAQTAGGVSNTLGVRCTAASGKSTATVIYKLVGSALTIGANYRLNFEYYIHSTNDEVFYVDKIVLGGVTTSVDSSAVTTDTWHSRTINFTAVNTSTTIYLFMNDDSTSGIADSFNIINVELYPT